MAKHFSHVPRMNCTCSRHSVCARCLGLLPKRPVFSLSSVTIYRIAGELAETLRAWYGRERLQIPDVRAALARYDEMEKS